MSQVQATTIVIRPEVVTARVSSPSQVTSVRVNTGLPGNSSGRSNLPPIVASTALSALRIVALNELGQLEYADTRIALHATSTLGMILQAVSAGEAIAPVRQGLISDPSFGFIVGEPLFLRYGGYLSHSPTINHVFNLQVGIAVGVNQVLLDIGEPSLYEFE